jgi:hypothetical protein
VRPRAFEAKVARGHKGREDGEEIKTEKEARQVSRASVHKTQLLLIAGRVQGVPQISFDVQPVGTVTGNMQRADVSGPIQSNILKRMMRLKLVSQTALEAVTFANIKRGEVSVSHLFAEDIDAFNGTIDCPDCI